MKWDNSYDINFKKLALLLLPTMFRKRTLFEIAKVLVVPVVAMHGGRYGFMNFRREKDFRLTHNGQRCYLRGCLNDLYDPLLPDGRQIEIGEAEEAGVQLIFKRENEDNMVVFAGNVAQGGYPLAIIRREVARAGLDFTVKVPQKIFNDPVTRDRIKATVKEYRLASKQFNIIPKKL